jgi:predicted methyltransferase
MRVAELAAGGGYTTEALARAVGPSGKVYGQNSKFILERFAETPWSTRLKKPVMGNVERVNSEFDAPLPELEDLDAVVMVLFYHDTVWMNTDRAAMNKAVYAALKPGGVYGIVDHDAKAGDGVKEASNLHRIEESVVKSEVAAAGFKLAAEANFLRNPSDAKDWNASPTKAAERRGKSDRFVLKFVKP